MFKMAYVTLLLSVLTFIIMVYFVDKAHTLELMDNMIVDQYHIKLKLYPNQNSFSMGCRIHFKTFRATTHISMFKDKYLFFEEAIVVNKEENVDYEIANYTYSFKDNVFSLYFENVLLPESYILQITFSSVFSKGLQQIYSDEREELWLSSIEGIILCWIRPKEEPSMLNMFTFNFSILHFQYHSIITNMIVREEKLGEKELYPNMKWTYFDTTPRISPYQLSFVMSNDIVSMWSRSQSEYSLYFALTAAVHLVTFLKRNKEWQHYRFPTRMKLIVIPNLRSSLEINIPERNDSLVHTGIIMANEADIICDEENDSVGHQYNVKRLIQYKVMQEYYEWIVNPYWEPSTWLSKGFATFIATHHLNQMQSDWRMIDLFLVQIQHECLDFDFVDKRMLPIPDQNGTIPVEIIDNMKASILLRMLQHACNAEAFWKAIVTFTNDSVLHEKKHHLKIFWKALKDAHGKIKKGAKTYDIEVLHLLLEGLVEGKGCPELHLKRYYHTPTSTMEFLGIFNSREEIQSIPVSYTTRTNLNFNQTRPRIRVSSYNNSTFNIYPYYGFFPPRIGRTLHINKNSTIDLNYIEDSWVILNIQQTGYYRVNYDDENWARISTYLNDDDYWRIHVLNRAQLIDDAFHFMLLGKLRADIFWQLTRYLRRETDYIAWYPMFKAIEYISICFQFYEGQRSIWPKLDGMLGMLLSNIRYEKQPTHYEHDFTKALRQEAARWACGLKLSNCTKTARFLLEQHLETHTKLSPWWKKWTYCYGLSEANNITWHQTLNKIKGNDNDKFLYLVTCPNHLVKINIYTSTTYTNDDDKSHITNSTMVQFELRHFVYTIVDRVKMDVAFNYETYGIPYKDNRIYKDLLNNFAYIKPRQLKLSTALLILFNNIYSIKHLDDVRNATVFKDIPESHIGKKLQARKNQIKNHDRLFARIEPRN